MKQPPDACVVDLSKDAMPSPDPVMKTSAGVMNKAVITPYTPAIEQLSAQIEAARNSVSFYEGKLGLYWCEQCQEWQQPVYVPEPAAGSANASPNAAGFTLSQRAPQEQVLCSECNSSVAVSAEQVA